ncbi:hypothetical protein HOY80DRAFT_1134977 [Tuber brumale]|nr:hypothetical protein HOY80DRAFT_1134977 [Tuber brumale]
MHLYTHAPDVPDEITMIGRFSEYFQLPYQDLPGYSRESYHKSITMLLKPLPILALFLTLTHAAALADPFAEADSDLEKRACVSDGCKCDSSYSAGLYCGYCAAVKSCTSSSCFKNVYQCGSGGKCCNYGVRTSCKNFDGPCG